jgi:Cu(I)-responsive transcriptional regulator
MMTKTMNKTVTQTMNISQAAATSGVSAKMIRRYESISLIPKASRSESGYRIYRDSDIHILAFVKSARDLGFSMPEIKKLVGLWRNKSRASADVKNLALKHVQDMELKIKELQKMVNSLKHLANSCQGNSRPECPILENLAELL